VAGAATERVWLNGRNYAIGETVKYVRKSLKQILEGRQAGTIVKKFKDWGAVSRLTRRQIVVGEVVRDNPRTLVVRLPDGNVVKRKRARDIVREGGR
jgi:hypothetical protein